MLQPGDECAQVGIDEQRLGRAEGDVEFVERADRLDETLQFLSDPNEEIDAIDEWELSGITSKADIAKGLLPRQSRAFREIFQLIKEQFNLVDDVLHTPEDDEESYKP